MNDILDCTIFLLAKAYQKAHGNFKKKLQSYGLTPIQHLVLEALWIENGLVASEIGKGLILDSATLSGVLDRMSEAGWIVKKSDTDDRRFVRIYLSSKAEEMKIQLLEERKKANDEILSGFKFEEKVLLKRFLRDLM